MRVKVSRMEDEVRSAEVMLILLNSQQNISLLKARQVRHTSKILGERDVIF